MIARQTDLSEEVGLSKPQVRKPLSGRRVKLVQEILRPLFCCLIAIAYWLLRQLVNGTAPSEMPATFPSSPAFTFHSAAAAALALADEALSDEETLQEMDLGSQFSRRFISDASSLSTVNQNLELLGKLLLAERHNYSDASITPTVRQGTQKKAHAVGASLDKKSCGRHVFLSYDWGDRGLDGTYANQKKC